MCKVWNDKVQVQSDTVGLGQHEKNTDRQNTDATSQHGAAQTISKATQTAASTDNTALSQDFFQIFF